MSGGPHRHHHRNEQRRELRRERAPPKAPESKPGKPKSKLAIACWHCFRALVLVGVLAGLGSLIVAGGDALDSPRSKLVNRSRIVGTDRGVSRDVTHTYNLCEDGRFLYEKKTVPPGRKTTWRERLAGAWAMSRTSPVRDRGGFARGG